MADTPIYYVNNFPTITGDIGAIEDKLAGEGSNLLVSSLSEYLKVGRESTTLNFLTKSTASEFVGQTVRIVFNPDTAQYQVDGKVVVNIAGGAATDAVVAGVLSAVLSALGVGTSVVGVTAVAVGLASFWLWDALSEETDSDEEIASFIDNVIKSVRGPVPVDVQIVDTNGNVLGGVLFEEDVDQAAEFEAIKKLLGRTLLTSFPDISIGKDRIKVVEKTRFSPQEKEYKVYDGRFVDAISQELGIAKEELLGLGQENSPNTNAQIYYESPTFNPKSFVFTSDENRFFVPLPDTSGGVAPVGLHPGNIISGSSGDDTLDAFQDRDPDLLFTEQNILLLGLEGNDIINGNVEDDIIVGGKGNDTIDGGFGEDIVIFSDRFKNYDYSISEDGTITFSHMRGTRKDGTDKLKNVEFARFKDQIVPLPLDEETITRLEDSKDDVTFRFEATVAEFDFDKDGNLDPGTAIPLVLEYSFDPELRPGLSLFGSAFVPIDGVLSIGGQSTSIRNGRLVAGSRDYYIQYGYTNSDIGGSLFGLKLNSLGLSFQSDNNEFKYFFDGSIPTSADFAQRADSYDIVFSVGRFPEFRLFAEFSPSFTLESDGDRNNNNSPIAVDDEISALAGTVVSLPILDLLKNDGDPDEDNLIFDGIDNVVNGTILIVGENIEFAPNAEFTGLASFDYTISDGRVSEGLGLTDTATVTINFTASNNEAPVAINDSFQIDEDDVLADNVLLNDSDVDSDDLVVNLLTTVKHGNLTLNSDGSFLYFPDDNFNGNDSFIYEVSDGGLTDTATVTLIIKPVKDAPVAVNDSVSTLQDTPIIINVLENDSDVDDEVLAISNVGNAVNSSIKKNNDNTITYIPNTGFSGNDSFSYTISDSNGETATAIVSVAVATNDGVPDIPINSNPDIPTPTSKFQVSLVESKSNLVNELAVFTVDDDAGTINGLVPGSEGYAQAALNKARSIFSTIANLPNGFDTGNLSSIIEFDTASSLRFMLVKHSTLDNVKNGITPISNLLFSDLSLQQISNLADSVFPLSWKDSFGNTTDFKDLVIKIGANTETLPLGTAIQSKSGIELIDLRSDLPPNEIVKAEFSVYREAAFNNYVGFYKINDTDGSITDPFTGNILNPGDVGYIQTAVGNRVAGIDLKVANNSIETLSGEFISGSLFAPFIIINASPTEVLDTNIQNDPNVYFAFLGANTDRVDHIRLLSNNVFGFEDLPNGGDLDYNDMIIAANFRVS
jgi:VCBS repeat-containing protein